jgi:hypothetical protein
MGGLGSRDPLLWYARGQGWGGFLGQNPKLSAGGSVSGVRVEIDGRGDG